MFEALTTSRKWSLARRYTSRSSTKAPRSVVKAAYWAWPIANLAASLLVMRWMPASASRPATSIWPMWLTSNNPARVRTAKCSSVMPLYSTGISQPPNGTKRAPIATWRAYSGVRRRADDSTWAMKRVCVRDETLNGTMRLGSGQGGAAILERLSRPQCSWIA